MASTLAAAGAGVGVAVGGAAPEASAPYRECREEGNRGREGRGNEGREGVRRGTEGGTERQKRGRERET